MLVVKKNHLTDPYNQSIKIYRTTFDKMQQKISVAGALTFTDEMKVEQTITHEELSTPHLQCWTNKDFKYLFIQAEPIPPKDEQMIGDQE